MGLLYNIISDHKKIRKMLIELENWADGKSNLSIEEISAKIKEIGKFWNEHEKREEQLFEELTKKNMSIPFEKLDTAHKDIKKYWNSITAALISKNNIRIKKVLEDDGRMLVKKIKKHMEDEEPIFENLNFNFPFSRD